MEKIDYRSNEPDAVICNAQSHYNNDCFLIYFRTQTVDPVMSTKKV